jgi:hypothetical protein
VAILSDIPLPLSKKHFDEIWSRGDELFFHAWGEVSSKRQDPDEILDRLQKNNRDVPEGGIVVHVDFKQ